MRSPFRSALLLGSAYALLVTSNAFADDPLVPEGAEPPKMGKELILPPVINEAPPGSAIALPPPGQEHLLGERPDGAKIEARLPDEPVADTREAKAEAESADVASVTAGDAPAEPPKAKKRARKVKAEAIAHAEPAPPSAQVAAAPAEKNLYAGITRTAVPDQSLVVPEGHSAAAEPVVQTAGIEKTNARLDAPVVAMGGPELSGPPKPNDGMSDTPKPIRDGDALSRRQERALAVAEAPVTPAKVKTAKAPQQAAPVEPAKAPAIERFEIAQATAAPLPVTPGSARAAPDWSFEISAKSGYAWVNTAKQRYQAGFDTLPVVGGRQINNVRQGLVSSDDDGEAVPLELAFKANLEDHMEPLSIFGIGAQAKPWVSVSAGGSDTTFRNAGVFASGPDDGFQIVSPTAGTFNILDTTGSASFRGKQKTRGGKVLYGQSSEGQGVTWTGYGGISYIERTLRQVIAVTASGKGSASGFFAAATPAETFAGGYDTRLKTGSTSFILGVGAEVPLDSAKRITVDAYGQASYDINRVSGNDSVSVVNGAGGTVLAGTRRLQRTDSSIGYGAGIGLNYALSDSVRVRVGADYSSQEAAPVIVRDGVNPSRVDLEREDVFTGSVTATFKF